MESKNTHWSFPMAPPSDDEIDEKQNSYKPTFSRSPSPKPTFSSSPSPWPTFPRSPSPKPTFPASPSSDSPEKASDSPEKASDSPEKASDSPEKASDFSSFSLSCETLRSIKPRQAQKLDKNPKKSLVPITQNLEIANLSSRKRKFSYDNSWTDVPWAAFVHAKYKIGLVEDKMLFIGLEAGEKLCFAGSAMVRCIRGCALICGYKMDANEGQGFKEVHSDKYRAALIIESVVPQNESTGEVLNGSSNLTSNVDTLGIDLKKALEKIPLSCITVVLVRRMPVLSVSFLFPSVYNIEPTLELQDCISEDGIIYFPEGNNSDPNTWASMLRLPDFEVLFEAPSHRNTRYLRLSKEWIDAADDIVASIRESVNKTIVICGPKSAGKSTMCRYIANRLLSENHAEIAFLDSDVGQPELTPPGMVSMHILRSPIFGPPHMQLRDPELAFFLGATTSKSEPVIYTSYITALCEWYKLNASQMPLLVNTDGFGTVRGMGEEILGAILDIVSPAHVIELEDLSSLSIPSWRSSLKCRQHRVKAQCLANESAKSNNETDSASQRHLRLVAYFFQKSCISTFSKNLLDKNRIQDNKGIIARTLSAQIPYRVPWLSGMYVRLLGDSGNEVPHELVLQTLNASIVGLISAPKTDFPSYSDDSGPIRCLSEDIVAPCLGLGIVRSIDPVTQTLYVLTPVNPERLKNVNILCKGEMFIPAVMLYDPSNSCNPYFSIGTLKALRTGKQS